MTPERSADTPPALRVAVVGLGWWGRQLVTGLAGSDLVTVTDAVDPDTESAVDFASAHGLELHTGIDDVLADEAIDGVLIVTPHTLHERQVLAAAQAGKHVFCEKPLALDSDAARRMLTACRSRGLVLGVGHERRFEGAFEKVASMVVSGDLGTLLHVECNWSHNLFADAPVTWRQDPAQAPAGTLTALGVHMTDFFQSVAGPVVAVRAIANHRSAKFGGDDVITIQFEFASGVTGTLTNLATTPFYSRVTVFGDEGWVEAREWSNVDIPEPALLMWRGLDAEIHTRTFASTNSVRANIDAWARAATQGDEYRFTDDQLVHNVQILEAIVASARSGSVVTI